MRLTDIDRSLNAYQVVVTIPRRGIVKTVIFAANAADARALANCLYGRAAVQSLIEDKPPSPEQQQAKALNNRAKALKAQAGQIKARAAMKKANTAAIRANQPRPPSNKVIATG
jgi:hypothetical protein